MRVDVAIAGGGPAASVTAMLLARAGASCVILERDAEAGDKAGESLAPAARPLLEELDLWDALERDGHRPCHGTRSVWGASTVDEMPFVFTPYGHGWHLDRRRFERLLAERAVEAGAVRRTGARVVDVQRGGLTCDDGMQIESGFIVDATGRASSVARRLGARRVVDDVLVAGVAFLKNGGRGMEDSFTLIEAVEDGWWYSAPLPDARLVTMFVTDRAAASAAESQRPAAEAAAATRMRVREHGYAMRPLRWVDAGSSRLDRVAGDGWLAVGDAATALDPLSSHGLGNAIATGINAARAIVSGDVDRYVASVDAMWSGYVSLRRGTYGLERRWESSPFWNAASRRGLQ